MIKNRARKHHIRPFQTMSPGEAKHLHTSAYELNIGPDALYLTKFLQMAHDFCSCPWCRGHDFEHPVGHAHRFRDPWTPGNMRRHGWAVPDFFSGTCCEFCRVSSNIPGLREGLVELANIIPPLVQTLGQTFYNIHHYYRIGLRSDNPESHFLAREIETLSRHVRKIYRAFPERVELALWADELKYMGREIQAEPRRFRHNPIARHRNNRRLLSPQIAW